MSMFHCAICDLDLDSDYHEMYELDGLDICGDCFMEIKDE